MKHSLLIQDLISFLEDSPTAWHAVERTCEELLDKGYIELSEEENWLLEPGRHYVVTRNGTSLCAFITPKKFPKRLRLVASHTDSPSLKLKPHCEIHKHWMVLLGVEIYGAPLLTSWLNRDLGIAGRVIYLDRSGRIQENLVRLDRYPVTIPQLAIHLDREVNEKGLVLNKQEHLNAVAATEGSFPKGAYLDTLLREVLDFERLICHDLFLYPLEKPRLLGYKDSLLAAYRIDSLASVHAALNALISQPEPLEEDIKMVIFWDHEEVGSGTAQGAESTFFSQTLERIVLGYQGTREDYFCLLNRSQCFSIDLAHALHPNYIEKLDPLHQPILGHGIVVKSNAQQRYATNARSSIPIHLIAALEQLPLQAFVSRNDIPCGTTIGPIHAATTGIRTVDLGCGQLSMHSCRELMSCSDHVDMCRVLEKIFQITDWIF